MGSSFGAPLQIGKYLEHCGTKHRTTIMGKRWESRHLFLPPHRENEWENQWAASVWVELY